MSGLWSYRSAVCSTTTSDVPEVVRQALPLATLGETAPQSLEDVEHPRTTTKSTELDGNDDYDDETFEYDDDEEVDHHGIEATNSNSYQTWLNGIYESVVASSQQSSAPREIVDNMLGGIVQYGGQLHGTLSLHVGSTTASESEGRRMMLLSECSLSSPEFDRFLDLRNQRMDSEQEMVLKRMISTSQSVLNLTGSAASTTARPSGNIRTSASSVTTPAAASSSTSKRSNIAVPQPRRLDVAPQSQQAARPRRSNSIASQEPKSRRRAERDALNAETRDALAQCAVNRKRADDEVERQRCIAAISSIQRSQQKQKILSCAPPSLVTSLESQPRAAASVRSGSATPSSSTSASRKPPLRGALPPQPVSARSKQSVNNAGSEQLVKEPCPDDVTMTIQNVSSSSTSTAMSYRDPIVRLAASLQRRQDQIDCMMESITTTTTPTGSVNRPFILNERAARSQRIQEFTFRTTARAQQKEDEKVAVRQAAEQRIDRHDRLRLLWFHAWLPWRKHMLLRSVAIRQATSFCDHRVLKQTFCGWRDAARTSRKISFAVSCAKAISLQRLFVWCWKRRSFLYWRLVVSLRRAQMRDAQRFRTKSILQRWQQAFATSRQAQDVIDDDVVAKFGVVRLRQLKRKVFNRWKACFDSLCIERERAAFRALLSSVAKDVTL